MNKRQYKLYQDGRRHARNGGGLSGCPYADTDGDAWRAGVRSVLDEQDGGGPCLSAILSRTAATPPARSASSAASDSIRRTTADSLRNISAFDMAIGSPFWRPSGGTSLNRTFDSGELA